tara:strand:- start:74672 stop:75250 length:579 start_codon:yes stop_codon:yes gene_type:complete
MNKEEYELHPKKCDNCKGDLIWAKRRNKYCDHSCAATQSNKGVRRHGQQPTFCKQCNKKNASWRNKFCSHECCNKYQYDIFIARWLDGLEKGYICGDNSDEQLSGYIRRWVYVNKGRKCCKCGWCKVHEITNKIPVQINHIDGDARNNRPENLEVLCPNCHSLTKNYGSLNNGNGRKGRYSSKHIAMENRNN